LVIDQKDNSITLNQKFMFRFHIGKKQIKREIDDCINIYEIEDIQEVDKYMRKS